MSVIIARSSYVSKHHVNLHSIVNAPDRKRETLHDNSMVVATMGSMSLTL